MELTGDAHKGNGQRPQTTGAGTVNRGPGGEICPRGKTPFPTQRKAEEKLAAILADPVKRALVPCRVYQCEHCSMWHLTARPEIPERITREQDEQRRRLGLD